MRISIKEDATCTEAVPEPAHDYRHRFHVPVEQLARMQEAFIAHRLQREAMLSLPAGTRGLAIAIFSEQSPCDSCGWRKQCASERLACTEFRQYVSHGSPLKCKVACKPTHDNFRRIYGAD
jgi:hypothetical protein